MLDAAMQARGKARLTRVLGQPKRSPRLTWSMAAVFVVSGAAGFYFWPTAPGDEQLGRLAILSSCAVHTPGQAWLAARSAVDADGAILSASQRRAAMTYLLDGKIFSGCNEADSQNSDAEAFTLSESD